MFTVESFPYQVIVNELSISKCYSWFQSIDTPNVLSLHLPIVSSLDMVRLYRITRGSYFQVNPDLVNGCGLQIDFFLN